MSIHKSQMFGGELIFLDILVVLVGFVYGVMTGHYIPLILGAVFIAVYLYSDKLYFFSLIMGIITLLSIIFFIFYDNDASAISEVGISTLYMLMIFLKSRSIFNAE